MKRSVVGFILLLLVTLSVPIIKSIFLLHIDTAKELRVANIGVFGECIQGYVGINYKLFNGFIIKASTQNRTNRTGFHPF